MSEPIVIPAALDGERLDRTVALLTGWPRAAVQALLDDGSVLVDGQRGRQEPSARRRIGGRSARGAGGEPTAEPRPARRRRRPVRRRRCDRGGEAGGPCGAHRRRTSRRNARQRLARVVSRDRERRRHAASGHRAPARSRHQRAVGRGTQCARVRRTRCAAGRARCRAPVHRARVGPARIASAA